MKKTILLLITLLLASFTFAAEWRTGEDIIISEEINDNVYLAGGEIDVKALIKGDLLAAGGDLTFDSVIEEDLTAAGGNIDILKDVKGDARLAGGDIMIDSIINGDALIAAGQVTLSRNSVISGDLAVSSGDVDIKGTVMGDVKANAGSVKIDSTINGNVKVNAGDLKLSEGTIIKGNLTYTTMESIDIDPNQVQGSITYVPAKKIPFEFPAKVIGFIFLLVVGLLSVLLFENFMYKTVDNLKTNFLKSAGFGFLVLIGVPIALLILVITLIGIPLALIGIFLYFLLIYISTIIVGFFLGNLIFKNNKYLAMVVGLFAIYILINLPGIGWLFNAIAVISGIGAAIIFKRKKLTKKKRK